MDPLKWGWELQAGNLQPIGSECPAAPTRLLKMIFCECKSGCKEISACSCRRAGQLWTPMRGQCVGVSCTNVDAPDICQNRCLWLGLVRPTLRSWNVELQSTTSNILWIMVFVVHFLRWYIQFAKFRCTLLYNKNKLWCLTAAIKLVGNVPTH